MRFYCSQTFEHQGAHYLEGYVYEPLDESAGEYAVDNGLGIPGDSPPPQAKESRRERLLAERRAVREAEALAAEERRQSALEEARKKREMFAASQAAVDSEREARRAELKARLQRARGET